MHDRFSPDAWERYHYWHDQWRRMGEPKNCEPMRPFQSGSHIDTLPIEHNTRGSSGVLIPALYGSEPQPPPKPPTPEELNTVYQLVRTDKSRKKRARI